MHTYATHHTGTEPDIAAYLSIRGAEKSRS